MMRDPSRGSASRGGESGASTFQTILVLAIVALLIWLAVPMWNQLADRARAYSCQENQRKIAEAIAVARTDGKAGTFQGYFDAVFDIGTPWGSVLIPGYISKPLRCPTSGQLYNLTPFGEIRSDMGAGQYFFVNQGRTNDHHWTGK